MNSSSRLAPVIPLPVRRATAPQAGVRRKPRTLILSATLLAGTGEIHRHIGIDDSMSLDELHKVIDICFGLAGENPPWVMYAGGRKLEAGECVHRVLGIRGGGADLPDPASAGESQSVEAVATAGGGATGDVSDVAFIHDGFGEDGFSGEERDAFAIVGGPSLDYEWGLWHIDVEVVDEIVRDAGTPRALCVGGTGALRDEEFDPSIINATLTGDEVIEQTLSLVDEHVANVIRRSGMYDFIALLQALDISRPSTGVTAIRLPVERDLKSKDAFVAMLLSLACMSDDYLTDTVAITVMDALGWGELSPEAIRSLCAQSLAELESLGAYGASRKSPVDRIDIYRELLRRHG